MIARWHGETLVMDIDALSRSTGRSVATIRVHCKPIGRDHHTRRNLYDANACQDTLDDVPKRQRVAH